MREPHLLIEQQPVSEFPNMSLMRIDKVLHARRPLALPRKRVDFLLNDDRHEELVRDRDDPRELATQGVVESEFTFRALERWNHVVRGLDERESVDEVFCAAHLEEEGEDLRVDVHRVGPGCVAKGFSEKRDEMRGRRHGPEDVDERPGDRVFDVQVGEDFDGASDTARGPRRGDAETN
jgi:hypothetical protein